MKKIERLVSVRERTSKELGHRLEAASFTPEEIEDALNCALRCNLVNDERYTRLYIQSKINSNWGAVKIRTHLLGAGISQELIEQCSDAFLSSKEEYEHMLKYLNSKNLASRSYSSIVRHLVSRGYLIQSAKKAAHAYLEAAGTLC